MRHRTARDLRVRWNARHEASTADITANVCASGELARLRGQSSIARRIDCPGR